MRRHGFTLTEIMIGLALALFIVIAAFEFFGITRELFGKIKEEEVETQSAEAALDKIRIDLLRAGQGLVAPMRNSTIAGVETDGGTITVALAERSYELGQDLAAGQTRVSLTTTSGLGAQREICLVESGWGEIHSISAVETAAVVLGEPLGEAFSRTGGQAHLIERISYYPRRAGRDLKEKGECQPGPTAPRGCRGRRIPVRRGRQPGQGGLFAAERQGEKI